MHVRWSLELPGASFHLLAPRTFLHETLFYLLFCDLCFGCSLRKLNCIGRLLKNLSALTSMTCCQVNKEPAKRLQRVWRAVLVPRLVNLDQNVLLIPTMFLKCLSNNLFWNRCVSLRGLWISPMKFRAVLFSPCSGQSLFRSSSSNFPQYGILHFLG